MNPSSNGVRFSEDQATIVRAQIKSLFSERIAKAFDTEEKIRKAKSDNGTFDVIISTEAVDRAGEVVMQSGWDFTNYKNNAIVLWGHDYYSLPIGACTETYMTTYRGKPALGARGVFLSADINPLAQQVRKLYEFGLKTGTNVGTTTSVGFIPKEFDPKDQNIITKSELLEFSFVCVPANQDVGPAAGVKLTYDDARELGIDTFALASKGFKFADKKKSAEVGDKCTMDDGSPGILTTDPKDPKGALVCLPSDQDKGKSAGNESGDEPNGNDYMKNLHKAIETEHDRHDGAVKKAFDDFRVKAAAVIEDQPDMNDGDEDDKKKALEKSASSMAKCMKALKSALSDEHDMHRSKNVECFRSFVPPKEKKDFEIEKHLKTLKAEHKTYGVATGKSFDEFMEKMKTVVGDQGGEDDSDADDADSHTDWITAKMIAHQADHRANVKTIAKDMATFQGAGETTEERSLKAQLESVFALLKEIGEKIDAKDAGEEGEEEIEEDGEEEEGEEEVEVKGEDGEEEKEKKPEGEPKKDESVHDASADAKEFKDFIVSRDLARALSGALNAFLSASKKGLKRDVYQKQK